MARGREQLRRKKREKKCGDGEFPHHSHEREGENSCLNDFDFRKFPEK